MRHVPEGYSPPLGPIGYQVTTGVKITESDKQNLLDKKSRRREEACHALCTQGQHFGAMDQTQCFMQGRQALYRLSYISSPLFLSEVALPRHIAKLGLSAGCRYGLLYPDARVPK